MAKRLVETSPIDEPLPRLTQIAFVVFEPFKGLPPVIAEYLTALNDSDIPRALACVHPDALVTTESETAIIVRERTSADFEQWLIERFGTASIAIAPVNAEMNNEITRLYIAVTRIEPTGEVESYMNHADYTVVDGLITVIHVYLPRRRRVRED